MDGIQLYYNKRSQFVSGNETDKVQVCVGQRVSLTKPHIARDNSLTPARPSTTG